MARPRKIPKRLPTRSKEFQKLINEVIKFIPEMARFEKNSIALDNARKAITPEPEPREKQIELTGPENLPTEKKTRGRKKHIELSAAPGDEQPPITPQS